MDLGAKSKATRPAAPHLASTHATATPRDMPREDHNSDQLDGATSDEGSGGLFSCLFSVFLCDCDGDSLFSLFL